MKRVRLLFCAVLTGCMLLLSTVTAAAADSGNRDLPKLDKYEIIELFQQLPDVSQPENYYDEAPSLTAPHTTGKVRQELLDSGLAQINLVRRLAGLPGVTMTDEYNLTAQYGSVVLAAGNQFDHFPAQPDGMDSAFYEKGYYATSHANLAYFGWSAPWLESDPISSSIDGYMADSDVGNVAAVGHRRWVLDPSMGAVGLGLAHNTGPYMDPIANPGTFSNIFSTMLWDTPDHSTNNANYDFVAWPASGWFPNTNFIIDEAGNNIYRRPRSDAWSVSLNPLIYKTPTVSSITVTLTGPDGENWTFTGGGYQIADAGPYFTVNTKYIGEGPCIIFRPDGIEQYEGEYTVSIEGLKDKDNRSVPLEYTVNFFTPTCLDGHSYTLRSIDATCTAPGGEYRICDVCGHTIPLSEEPSLGHQWSAGAYKDEAYHTVTCMRPSCGITEDILHDRYTTETGDIACSGCNLQGTGAVCLTFPVPTVNRWAPNEEGYMAPFGDAAQFDLSEHVTLSGALAWQLSAPQGVRAALDHNGLLTVYPESLSGSCSVFVSNGTQTEMILVELTRNPLYCWGGTVPTSVSKVDVPLPGEDSLQIQYNATFYDQYGGILESPSHEVSWFIQPQDDQSSEYTEYNGITIDSNGLLTVPAGAKSCQLNVRCRPSCWNSNSACGTSLSVCAAPALRWTSPGYLTWDAVEGAYTYSVAMLDENGVRVGGFGYMDTRADVFPLLGAYVGNESHTYRLVVEVFNASGRVFKTLDSGVTLRAQVREDALPYSTQLSSANQYDITIKHPVSPGDILLDSWTTADCRTSYSWLRFYHSDMYFTQTLNISGLSHTLRLITDSQLENNQWSVSLTAAVPQSSDELDMADNLFGFIESVSNGNVSGECIIGPTFAQGTSAYLMLNNYSSEDITANVMVAEYDTNERMIGCSIRQIALPTWEKTSVTLYPQHENTASVKIFILDESYSALTTLIPF